MNELVNGLSHLVYPKLCEGCSKPLLPEEDTLCLNCNVYYLPRTAYHHIQDNETFMLDKNERNEFVLKALVKGEWANQFGFDLQPMEWIDFSLANYYNSTHPDAVFVKQYLVMQQHAQGRTLLSGNQLKRLIGDQEIISEVSTGQIDEVLWQEFGLRRE